MIRGLPEEAATWRQDKPGWTREDEWSARVIESLEHWGPVLVMAMSGAKASQLPSPSRLFEHPDRPEPDEKPQKAKAKKKGERRLATPQDITRTLSGTD